MQPSWRDRLAHAAHKLSGSQRVLADHLHHHQKELAYASAAQVARDLNISPSTVVRFAQLLGYDGWPALQAELRARSREDRRLVELAPTSDDFLAQFVQVQRRNLDLLATQARAVEQAATVLASAQNIWLGGDRASSYIAGYAAHFLRLVRPGVRLLNGGSGAVDKLLDVQPTDALWLTSMSRYSRRSVKLAQYLSGKVPIVLLTDEVTSPLIPYATTRLHFASAAVTSLRSDAAAYATAHALVLAVAQRVPGTRARLEQAEALWGEFDQFHKEE